MPGRHLSAKSTKLNRTDVNAFLKKVASLPPNKTSGRAGRLLFAMDATASREPTWDRACNIQGEMFKQSNTLGGLELQLCYYRGFQEFKCTPWLRDSATLAEHMVRVPCAAGITQIERVLQHGEQETRSQKVNAIVFIGDSMEENIDVVCDVAGRLRMLALPVFMFQEGGDFVAARAYQEIARLSRGAYCQFNGSSAQQLRDLLSAVAVFASGGRQALENFGTHRRGITLKLTQQMNKS